MPYQYRSFTTSNVNIIYVLFVTLISIVERIFMFTWLPMPHLPKPPDHFIKRAHEIAQQHDLLDTLANTVSPDYLTRVVVKNNKEKISRYQRSRSMGEDWNDWVRNNLVTEFIETGLRVSLPVSDIHGPHTDPMRKWKLYYLIERGGHAAVTKFYKEHGRPAVRDLSDSNVVCNNMDMLEEIDSVQWPEQQWVLLNTMVLHSVEFVEGLRYNLTVGIKPGDLSSLYRYIGTYRS